MSFIIKGNFFCRFKIGDNIIYNLSILKKLYEYQDQIIYKKEILVKPIVLIIVSIIEAILHDFHLRIKANVNEGVPGLLEAVLLRVRNEQIDKLKQYIDSAKRHDLFKLQDESFYDSLHNIRKIRNRVHIQNIYGEKPANELDLFIESTRIEAEKCLEKVVKTMSSQYARPNNLANHVGDLEFPWKEHFN